jgi:hypothetical protein
MVETWYIGARTKPEVTSSLLPLESNAISCMCLLKLSVLQNLVIKAGWRNQHVLS